MVHDGYLEPKTFEKVGPLFSSNEFLVNDGYLKPEVLEDVWSLFSLIEFIVHDSYLEPEVLEEVESLFSLIEFLSMTATSNRKFSRKSGRCFPRKRLPLK